MNEAMSTNSVPYYSTVSRQITRSYAPKYRCQSEWHMTCCLRHRNKSRTK